MSTLVAVAWIGAAFALLPLAITIVNLRGGLGGFRRPDAGAPPRTRVSVLIPARDEEAHIEASVRAVLASTGVDVEVVVLDDHSTDRTAALVGALAAADPRVRLVTADALPAGWAGKQFACWQLAHAARHEVLMFIDADVLLSPLAVSLAAGLLLSDESLGLVSGFPFQRTGSLAEELVVPWIHVLLLGYLPMAMSRRSRESSFAAGCGQWMVARRAAYMHAGGHRTTPASRHDGLSLPRTFRRAGWRTDLFDGGELARCRMYTDVATVRTGFAKSSGEGMATPRAIVVWTVLLLLGHVVPWIALLAALVGAMPALAWAGGIGVAANLALRALLMRRLGQRATGALLHPVGALCVLLIQWSATLRFVRGAPSSWKGRSYTAAGIGADR